MSTIHCCFQPNTASNTDVVFKMLESSNYWQPDKTSWASNTDNTCHLAKASLFNTAQSVNDDVYTDAQTGTIISAHARIDNRKELIETLNINDKHITDGELILRAYYKWGKTCCKHLFGDFVFVIWNALEQKVFCARDHFGVKVLLYSKTEQGVMISNEPNAFFTSKWLEKKLKESWLVDAIWSLGPTDINTAYKQLEVLPAGHYMEMDKGGVTIESYWELTDNSQWQGKSDEELLDELKSLFENAVSVRLESDYPLACELSEGLDSNAIAGFAANLIPKETIYTLSYACAKLTDKTRAIWENTYKDILEMLAMHNNLSPIWTEEQSPKDITSQLIENTGGVFDLKGGWLWHCNLASRTNSRVLLSGWGGDHCVSTYGDFYESELFKAFKWSKVHRLFKVKHKRGRSSSPLKSWGLLIVKHTMPWLHKWHIKRRRGLESALLQRSQFNPLKKQYIDHYSLMPKLKKFLNGYRNYFSIKEYHCRELFDIGVEKRLIDSELSARMHRVEFRYPMLDVPLVEFAYNLPSHLKIYKGIERYAFREILIGVTTERIRCRVKSDVDHPNIDPLRLSENEDEEIKALTTSSLFQKYCESEKMFNQNSDEAKFSLSRFKSTLPLLDYYEKHKVVVEKD